MTRLFISYAHADVAIVGPLANALEASGHAVWWSRELQPGQAYLNVIQRQLDDCERIVVVWSVNSATSHWVKAEANVGFERRVLCPVRIDHCTVSPPFNTLHTIDLSDWAGSIGRSGMAPPGDAAFRMLLKALEPGQPSQEPRLHARWQVSSKEVGKFGARITIAAEHRSHVIELRSRIGTETVLVDGAVVARERNLSAHRMEIPFRIASEPRLFVLVVGFSPWIGAIEHLELKADGELIFASR